MSLTLYYHPLSSFCWKALIALYENDTPFTPEMVDLSNENERAALLKIWPIGKFPVLRDSAKDRIVPESSIIIEYLDTHYSGATKFLPADADAARQVRLRDRFYDLYVHLPMQKVMGDRLRPAASHDPYGVEEAKARITSCYGMIDKELASRTWAMGETFGLADCAAAVLRQHGGAVRRRAQERRRLSRTRQGKALLRARAPGSRALFQYGAEGGVSDGREQVRAHPRAVRRLQGE